LRLLSDFKTLGVAFIIHLDIYDTIISANGMLVHLFFEKF